MRGEVDGSRKKRNPRFHARVTLCKEEDMTVEDKTKPETGVGF
jgi:hypothetical protein